MLHWLLSFAHFGSIINLKVRCFIESGGNLSYNFHSELNQRLEEYGKILSVVEELPIMCKDRKLDYNVLKGFLPLVN